MSIFDAIQRAQSLVDSLTLDSEQMVLANQLKAELSTILSYAEQSNSASKQLGESTQVTPNRDAKSGCYVMANDASYFCPNCYDRNHSLIATQRINSKLRVCPSCRSSIKPKG